MGRSLRPALVAIVALGLSATAASGCGSPDSADPAAPESPTTTVPEDVLPTPADPDATREVVLYRFTDPASTTGWTTVDDSVMGGVSASRVGWDAGFLAFSGVVTTDNNGGFVSALGPTDPTIGERARGSDSIGLGVRLDRGPTGRYLLWVRAADSRRWVAEFTPLTMAGCCWAVLPWARFDQVDRFLRPVTPAVTLDPAEIVQIGLYLLPDVRRVDFRLTIDEIVTGVMLRPGS
ncbi:MAG: hypothetical protein FGM58_05035 [Acidimicrobiia bacterium]|nr:hypothetical protein [Acidimicrobiia bacterium]